MSNGEKKKSFISENTFFTRVVAVDVVAVVVVVVIQVEFAL